jgi:nucleotide-binding universal stress UspA family protein
MQQVQPASAQFSGAAAARTSAITRFQQAAVAHASPRLVGARPSSSVYVVGLDASPGARSALSVAVGLGRSLGGSLVLVHELVATPPPSFGNAWGALRTYGAELRDAEALVRKTRRPGLGCPDWAELRFGDPPQAICHAANDHRPELIVVCSRGPDRLNRLLLGSVSRGVVERARCSVPVVRAGVSAEGSAASVLERATQ